MVFVWEIMDPDDNNSPEGSGDRPLEDIPLSLDAILDILAHHRRRILLEYLWEQPGNDASFKEVTEHILLKVGQKQETKPNHNDIQIELQHQHLPKMEDTGVIEYDIRSQTIRYHENERLEIAYERIHDLELN